tara:strand:+ start:563 stop:1036 length:474 start_codon:yes stop_codon:yes gene_type:complete
MTVYPKGSLARRLVESDEPSTGYELGSKADEIVRNERRLKKKKRPKKKITTRDSYQPKSDVIKPEEDKKTFSEKLSMYESITGQSPLQPLRDLIDGPQAPDMTVPDLVSEVRDRVELQKQKIASAPKMYPMYYERAKKGKFIKVKTKLGRTRKTKLL